jgi:multidrug efflux system outer membrane protein
MPDTTLHQLVDEALVNNHDLRIAVDRVEAARANSGIAGAPLWPWLSAGLSGTHLDRSEYFSLRDPIPVNNFQYGGSVSWEVDLFGRVRREKEAAVAEELGTEYDQRGVAMSLVSEVARQFILLRELDMRLGIAHRTLDSRQATLKLFTRRHLGGVASGLEISQAKGDLQDVASVIPNLERQIAMTENSISALLGRNPGPIVRDTLFNLTVSPPQVPVGLPSQLLERRPDVMAAEQRLRAANARVGVATALYFPSINLSAFLGGMKLELPDGSTSNPTAWSAGGSLFQPLFQANRIRNVNRAARAEYDASREQYLGAAQNSFREVADALVTVGKTKDQVEHLDLRVAALADGSRLAKVRYDGGLSSYLEVLDADRQLFAGENDLAGARGNLWRAYVELYRALGGGWSVPADSLGAHH